MYLLLKACKYSPFKQDTFTWIFWHISQTLIKLIVSKSSSKYSSETGQSDYSFHIVNSHLIPLLKGKKVSYWDAKSEVKVKIKALITELIFSNLALAGIEIASV